MGILTLTHSIHYGKSAQLDSHFLIRPKARKLKTYQIPAADEVDSTAVFTGIPPTSRYIQLKMRWNYILSNQLVQNHKIRLYDSCSTPIPSHIAQRPMNYEFMINDDNQMFKCARTHNRTAQP